MKTTLTRFMRRQDGASTVEFTLWVPFLVAFFVAGGELAMLFYGKSQLMLVAQDATRQVSIGRVQTADELSAYVSGRLSNMTESAQISSAVDKGVIALAVTVPMNDVVPFGYFTALINPSVTVVAQQVAEY